MMRRILILLVLCAPTVFSVCKGQAKNGYVLKGTLKGIYSGTVRLIAYNEDDRTSKAIDSAAIADGSFELKGSIDAPQMLSVQITPGNWSFSVFMEDTVLSIKADTAGARYYDYTAHGGTKGAAIRNYTETGSRNFDDWMRYQDDPGQDQYAPAFAALNVRFGAGKNVDEQYRIRGEMDSVRQLLQAWQKNKIDEYVSRNPSSVAGVYMFDQFYVFAQQMPVPELESMLGKFEGRAKSSVYYQRLAKQLARRKAVAPGSQAPDFTLLKRDSTSLTLSAMRGRYMLIDFWASWCHPCRQAIPHWKEVYSKYHSKGLDIVSVSDDSRWSDWIKAMDQEKMPWAQVCDEFPVKNMPARVGSLYMTTFIPFYVLLDKDGRILEYTGDENQIDARLKALFGI